MYNCPYEIQIWNDTTVQTQICVHNKYCWVSSRVDRTLTNPFARLPFVRCLLSAAVHLSSRLKALRADKEVTSHAQNIMKNLPLTHYLNRNFHNYNQTDITNYNAILSNLTFDTRDDVKSGFVSVLLF